MSGKRKVAVATSLLETELEAEHRDVGCPPALKSGARKKAKPIQAKARWQGQITGMQQRMLVGWAIDSAQPDARVVLEVCCNGLSVATVTADLIWASLPDLGQSDQCHGFALELPNVEAFGVMSVKIANLDICLPGELVVAQDFDAKTNLLNAVFSDGALLLFGWAMAEKLPHIPCRVQAWHGAQLIAQSTADLDHPYLSRFKIGQHGFRLALPAQFADGELREIRVVDEHGAELAGSPLSLQCYIPNGGDQPTTKVAQLMLQSLQRYIPRGLGIEHYDHWRQAFDVAEQLPAEWQTLSSAQQGAKIAVVLHGGVADDAALAHSLTSLSQQLTGKPEIICAYQDWPSAIQQLQHSEAQAIVFLRIGDSLPAAALAHAWCALACDQRADLLYSDSELALNGQEVQEKQVWCKPAWNPEYAFATDYPLQLMLVRTRLLRQLPWQQATNASELAWQLLAAAAKQAVTSGGNILHLPHVLYRFQSALTEDERLERLQAAQHHLSQYVPGSHLLPIPQFACAEMTPRLLQRPPPSPCSVCLIIPTRDNAEMLARAIDSLLKYTSMPALEIIVVDNDSREQKTFEYFAQLQQRGIKVLPAPGAFNFSRLNNLAVAATNAEVVGLINNDIEALHAGWLENMLAQLQAPDVAVVGAKLIWPNDMVQHGGVLLGPGFAASHFGNFLHKDDAGPHARNQVSMEVSAVTAACMLLRKSDYLAVGGMDEQAFPVAFNDVDLCLKLRQQGKRIIWCADALLLHAESASRGSDDTPQKKARAQRELQNLRRKWGDILLNDPAYHPSLSLCSFDHGFQTLAMPPRARGARARR